MHGTKDVISSIERSMKRATYEHFMEFSIVARLSIFPPLFEEMVFLRKGERTWEHGRLELRLTRTAQPEPAIPCTFYKLQNNSDSPWPNPHNACQNGFNIRQLSKFVAYLSKITQITRTIYNPFTPLLTIQRSSRNAS